MKNWPKTEGDSSSRSQSWYQNISVYRSLLCLNVHLNLFDFSTPLYQFDTVMTRPGIDSSGNSYTWCLVLKKVDAFEEVINMSLGDATAG